MTAKIECRLLIHPPGAGAWNMAVDEVLLDWSAAEGACCWRFYQWEEPTLSLGYFQDYADRWQHAASRDCPIVRRLTGGGTLMHDRELTYSIVVPAGHPLAVGRHTLYETVHNSLIRVLADFGIGAQLCAPAGQANSATVDPEAEPFLCFERRSPSDVVVGSTKVAGSAQRRRRGAVLQHGSVLLERSEAAPELGALNELAEESVGVARLIDMWSAALSEHLGVTWRREGLSEEQQRQAASLTEERYATPRWTERRGR
ncbi:MAG TPA: biotin/lipoate A/B protein ligase family protein [Thermoguttaceae bacterium]|nr:biotin/lipoate A/B protein ligase family protein [Thermoguttaceae bacterium]